MAAYSSSMIEEYLHSAAADVKAGSELVDAVHTFCDKMTKSVDDAIAKVDEMKHAHVKQAKGVRPCLQQFKIALEIASSFIEKAHDFTYYYSEERLAKVKTALTKGDLTALQRLLDQLKGTLAQAGAFHKQFTEEIDKSSESSNNEAAKCKHQAITARSKRKATEGIGGSAAVGAIGGGLALGGLALLAGALTFGIGPAVCLGVSGALVGGGIATAGVTKYIAEDFDDTSKSFTELSKIFDLLASGASNLNSLVLELHTMLEVMATVIDDVEARGIELASRPHGFFERHFPRLRRKLRKLRGKPGYDEARVEPVFDALDLLYKKRTVAYTATSSCHDSMKAAEKKLKHEI